MPALGKFEGDPFEPLFIKVQHSPAPADGVGESACELRIVTAEAGEEMSFDLLHRSFVFEDSSDGTSFILDHRKIIVVFRMESVAAFNALMRQMPPAVFMVAELSETEKQLLKGEDWQSRLRSDSAALILLRCASRERS